MWVHLEKASISLEGKDIQSLAYQSQYIDGKQSKVTLESIKVDRENIMFHKKDSYGKDKKIDRRCLKKSQDGYCQ